LSCAETPADQKVLCRKQSAYNLIVVTEGEGGRRTLWFEEQGARQSVVKVGDPDVVELPYARSMIAGLAFAQQPKRVLMIGLGGGTIPMLLHKHDPRMRIDVVDIDPVVVEVAAKYFGFREDSALRAYVDDGRRFIEKCREPYDVIFLDAFGPDNIPYDLATQEFLQSVRKAVTPRGIVLANIWGQQSNDLHDSMVRTYQAVFDDLYMLQVPNAGNEILVAMPRKMSLPRDRLVEQARRLTRQQEFPFDLGPLVEHGYRHLNEKDLRIPVLTDKNRGKKAG
jgi:spermidine synthase